MGHAAAAASAAAVAAASAVVVAEETGLASWLNLEAASGRCPAHNRLHFRHETSKHGAPVLPLECWFPRARSTPTTHSKSKSGVRWRGTMWVIEPIKQANGKGNEFRKAATSSGLKLVAFFAAVRVAHYAMNRPR